MDARRDIVLVGWLVRRCGRRLRPDAEGPEPFASRVLPPLLGHQAQQRLVVGDQIGLQPSCGGWLLGSKGHQRIGARRAQRRRQDSAGTRDDEYRHSHTNADDVDVIAPGYGTLERAAGPD
jgi:hypothetical protein